MRIRRQSEPHLDAAYDPPLLRDYWITQRTEGRTCHLHLICGLAVDVQDLLFICKETMVANGCTKPVGAVYHIVDGAIRCKVAFVPKFIALTRMIDLIDHKYLTVAELCISSTNPYKVLKDIKMNDMAACTVVDTVEQSRQLLDRD